MPPRRKRRIVRGRAVRRAAGRKVRRVIRRAAGGKVRRRAKRAKRRVRRRR